MKIVAIIAVVAVVAAGSATAYVMMQDDDNAATFHDGAYEFLARVNSEGSGIYIKSALLDDPAAEIPARNGTPFYSVDGEKYNVTSANKAAWEGLTLGTPGNQSIQYVQLLTLVKDMGLDFVPLAQKSEHPHNSVYYDVRATSFVEVRDTIQFGNLDGGILWEPQYQKLINDVENHTGYMGLALTNNLFPGHTCCTIIGNHDYIKSHSDETVRFLAGYVDAVEYIHTALQTNELGVYVNPVEYANLVNICRTNTLGLTEGEIVAALKTITYISADDEHGSLSTLESDIEQLAKDLCSVGVAKSKNLKDAGLFAEAIVNDSYLKDAVDYEYEGTTSATVRVAVINGDIHQIAIRVATELGFFSNYGIVAEVSTTLTAGGPVAENVSNNQADFGFVGAPPATIRAINMSLITE